MNRVLTTLTGGLPLTLDELELIQNNVKDMTSALGESLSFQKTTVKLYGIVSTINNPGTATPTLDVTKGLFWYLDELYTFDAVSGIALAAGVTQEIFDTTWFFDVEVTASNTVVFKDASSQDINEERKAVLTDTPATWVGLDYGSTEPLVEAVRESLGNIRNVKVELGDWDMDTVDQINVAIPDEITESNFVGIAGITIIPDSGSARYPLDKYDFSVGTVDGGVALIQFAVPKQVTLKRQAGTFFDSTSFDSTPFNRGFISFQYDPTV